MIMVTKAMRRTALKQARASLGGIDPKAKVIELLPGVLGPTPEEWADADIVEQCMQQPFDEQSMGAAAA